MLHSMVAQPLLRIRLKSAIIGWAHIVIVDGNKWQPFRAQLTILQD
jgi:hypothetical protein